MAFKVSYGTRNFDDLGPTPSVSFSVEPVKNGAGELLGSIDRISIKGIIFGSGISFTGGQETSKTTVPTNGQLNWQRFAEYSDYLRQDIKDYQELKVYCESNLIYKSNPNATIIESVNLDNNTDEYWRQFVDYTLNISVFNTGAQKKGYFGPASTGFFVTSVNDSYSINTSQDHGRYDQNTNAKLYPESKQSFLPIYNITRSTSANGIWTSGNSAIENARSCVTGMLSQHSTAYKDVLDQLDIIHSSWKTNIDDINGVFGVEHNIMAVSGSNNTLSKPGVGSGWIEDFTINTSIDQNLKRTVTIAGKVKGYTTRLNSGDVNALPLSFSSSKTDTNKFYWSGGFNELSGVGFYNASGGFFGKGTFPGVTGMIYSRAVDAIAPAMPTGSLTGIKKNKYTLHTGLNPIPLSINIDYDFVNESINYSYVFDSRPLNLVSGSLKETLTMEDSYATRTYHMQDVYYRFPVPQDMGTYSIPSRTVTYTAVLPCATGKLPVRMKTQIHNVIKAFDPAKLSPNQTVGATNAPSFISFLQASGENYDVLNRTYSLKCSWEYHKGYFPDGFYGGG